MNILNAKKKNVIQTLEFYVDIKTGIESLCECEGHQDELISEKLKAQKNVLCSSCLGVI